MSACCQEQATGLHKIEIQSRKASRTYHLQIPYITVVLADLDMSHILLTKKVS